MRIITKRMYERTNYIINYTQKSILLHPNFVATFYEIIIELYSSKNFSNMADTLFFEVIKTGLNKSATKQINEIQNEFNKQSDDIKITRSFCPRKLYPLRSGKEHKSKNFSTV